jgi:hypothetical protein
VAFLRNEKRRRLQVTGDRAPLAWTPSPNAHQQRQRYLRLLSVGGHRSLALAELGQRPDHHSQFSGQRERAVLPGSGRPHADPRNPTAPVSAVEIGCQGSIPNWRSLPNSPPSPKPWGTPHRLHLLERSWYVQAGAARLADCPCADGSASPLSFAVSACRIVRVKPDAGNPLGHQSSVLPRRHAAPGRRPGKRKSPGFFGVALR